MCITCYEPLTPATQFALACQHTFCRECWSEYLIEKVRSGCHGIDAKCMQHGCNLKVGHTVFEQILAPSPKDKETYWKWMCKSITDDNKAIRWCPNVQCEFCIERTDMHTFINEVTCKCGTIFCF